jgi:LuxR family transcriptional regulator, maltose regulon positive regulatory protein
MRLLAPTDTGAGHATLSVSGLSLTCREQDVLRLMAEGASNQQIAQVLVIELYPVKKHVGNVLRKLGAVSRTQAVARSLL